MSDDDANRNRDLEDDDNNDEEIRIGHEENCQVSDKNEVRGMLETSSFGSSFGSLDGIVEKKMSSDAIESAASSSTSSVMNMDILHWAGKIDAPASMSLATQSSTESTTSNSDPDKGKKLKRVFSDVTVISNVLQSAEESAKAVLNDDDNSNNSDNEEEDDDDDDEGEGEGLLKSKNTKESKDSSSRPNVREHSKAQREKRKGNICGLEQQARELTNDLNNMNCKFIAALETCRGRRQRQHHMIVTFLKLWIHDDNDGGNDVSNIVPKGTSIGFAARQSQWAALFSKPENMLRSRSGSGGGQSQVTADIASSLQQPISMMLPGTFSRFAPPMNASSYQSSSSSAPSQQTVSQSDLESPTSSSAGRVHLSFNPQEAGAGTKSRRVLSSLSHIIADSTSLAVMCQNISAFGPVQICHFMLGIDVPMEDFVSEDLIAVAPFYIYSKNATMCGGKFEIDLKGSSIYHLCLSLKDSSLHDYYPLCFFTKLDVVLYCTILFVCVVLCCFVYSGYLHCEFSSLGFIEKVELSYDDWHLTEQVGSASELYT